MASTDEQKERFEQLERRLEEVERQQAQERILDHQLLEQLEKNQSRLMNEIEILRAIIDISAQQQAAGSASRPCDVSRSPSGNALIERRSNWRIGRRFSR